MPAQVGMTTLRYVLTQQKMPVHCNMVAGRNTSNGRWPNPEVAIWTDFNLTNLNESYSHVLDAAVPEVQLVPIQPDQALAGLEINSAKDIHHLLGWNDTLMQRTLQLAKTQLRLSPGTILQYQCATPDTSIIPKLHNGGKNLVVHHIIALDDVTMQNLVVGLGRPSSKWSGRKLASQIPNVQTEIGWPLRQLANICEVAGTRYGYIQTDEELVVCCFSRNDKQWKAAIMPIPWTKHGDQVLTTDLAMWWLCMLAMSSPRNRAIVAEGDIVGIGDWDVVYFDKEQAWVRRHRYSNFEVPTGPPPPPAYQAFSPGNSAAFVPAVGLRADESFNPNDLGGLHADFSNSNDIIAPQFDGLFNFENCGVFDTTDTTYVGQDFNTASERGGE